MDARWSLTDGTTVFCEVKLSERDFGKAPNDERHLKKLADIYRPRLNGYVEPRLLAAPEFFGHYQILRNVWHLVSVPRSTLVFLLPKANTRLWRLLLPTLDFIAPATRNRIRSEAIEDVLGRVHSDSQCPDELRKYSKRLQAKYVPATSKPPVRDDSPNM